MAGAVVVAPGALFFAMEGITWRGRTFGLGLDVILWVVAVALVREKPPTRWPARRRWQAGILLASGLLLMAPALLFAPAGRGGDASLRVEHVFVGSSGRFPRFSLGNILPEADQASVGIALAPDVDRRMDRLRARRVRALVLPRYAAMARDPAFKDIGSVMSRAYADMLGRPAAGVHYVALVPRRPRAAILFLHGSAGNFALYWQVLAPLAREHGLAVICPSFGFGDWEKPGGVETAIHAADDACRRYSLDPARVVLVVLSNGGVGATRLVAAHPGRFRGVGLLSAVLEEGPVREGVERGAWRNLPVLLVHGEQDERVGWEGTREMAGEIERGGARMQRLILPQEDHFLFLSQRERVLETLAGWAGDVLGTGRQH